MLLQTVLIESYNPPPAAHLPPLPILPPPTLPSLIYAVHDITVFVVKVAQNPAVLASY